jgi:RNA polymerase sigma factor (sigma-70 family)
MHETLDLTSLVVRAKNGDNTAFDMLAERFRPFAVGFTLARLGGGGNGLAQDAVQDAFLEAWVCLPRLRHPAAFPAFLRRILVKRCDRLMRGPGNTAFVPLDTLEGSPAATAEPSLAAEANRQRAVLNAALATLSPADRSALLLHYACGESLAEVAGFLGLTIPTVKSRLYRARKRLREEMEMMENTVREMLNDYLRQVHRQVKADGPTPDAALLARARRKFDQEMVQRTKDAPLDANTVQLGFRLLLETQDYAAVLALLDHYLSFPLPPAEELWARWHRTVTLALLQHWAAAVTSHQELRTFAEHLSVKPAPLSRQRPYLPGRTPLMTAEEQTLWLLMAMPETSLSLAWRQVGAAEDWFCWLEETLARVPVTESCRQQRFFVRQALQSRLLASRKLGNAPLGSATWYSERASHFERLRSAAAAEGNVQEALRWEGEREK